MMNEETLNAWRDVLASGDKDAIIKMKNEILDSIHTRIMNQDTNYAKAGWKIQ